MTIGKKLYLNFGAVLAMVVVLFLVNLVAVHREHSAKAAAAASLELADATDAVKFQMMQNRMYLINYLLSGDTREVERMNEGVRFLNDKLQRAEELANSEQQKAAFQKVQQQEQAWIREFATPLVEKRKEVDGGNATVAELQIFYLQKDASAWIKSSTEYLDVADQESKKNSGRAAQIGRDGGHRHHTCRAVEHSSGTRAGHCHCLSQRQDHHGAAY